MENNKLIIDQLIAGWNGKIQQANQLFDKLGPKYSERQIVPGGNSVIYLMGHLMVVNDRLLEAMEISERKYPELDAPFLSPYDHENVYPSYEETREKWDTVNAILADHFERLAPDDWLKKHHYVTEADFRKEPQRNLLHFLISRSLHLANHVGQLLLVKI